MAAVIFPPRLAHLTETLQSSSYLENLAQNPKEQILKNNAQCTVSDIPKYYASRCGYLSPKEKDTVLYAVKLLYERFPSLPRMDVCYVVIHEDSLLEFGNTSFTVNNVVFLHPAASQDIETIQHETIHVLQRGFRSVFEYIYKSVGYRRGTPQDIERIRRILENCKATVIDNPDESLSSNNIYLDPQNRFVCYDHKLNKIIVDVNNGVCSCSSSSARKEVETLWGQKIEKDSMTEMMAVLMTAKRYSSSRYLREKIENLLRRVAQ